MTTRLNPYLNLAGTSRQAMEFYQSVLGGDLRISTFGEFGGAPEGLEADNIMHAMLETPSGLVLMASDTSAPSGQAGGQATSDAGGVSLSLSGEDADELRGYWERLSARGSVTMPLEKQMWGDEFGMLVDEFGMTWMVNITSPENAGS
jgi:PhnB protein